MNLKIRKKKKLEKVPSHTIVENYPYNREEKNEEKNFAETASKSNAKFEELAKLLANYQQTLEKVQQDNEMMKQEVIKANQNSEIANQKSEIANQKSETANLKSETTMKELVETKQELQIALQRVDDLETIVKKQVTWIKERDEEIARKDNTIRNLVNENKILQNNQLQLEQENQLKGKAIANLNLALGSVAKEKKSLIEENTRLKNDTWVSISHLEDEQKLRKIEEEMKRLERENQRLKKENEESKQLTANQISEISQIKSALEIHKKLDSSLKDQLKDWYESFRIRFPDVEHLNMDEADFTHKAINCLRNGYFEDSETIQNLTDSERRYEHSMRQMLLKLIEADFLDDRGDDQFYSTGEIEMALSRLKACKDQKIEDYNQICLSLGIPENSPVDDLKEKIIFLRDTIIMYNDMAILFEAQKNQMSETNVGLRQENQNLQTEKRNLESCRNTLEKEKQDLHEEVTRLTHDNEEYVESVRMLETQKNQMNETNEGLQQKNQVLQNEKRNLESFRNTLQKEKNDLQKQNTEKDKKLQKALDIVKPYQKPKPSRAIKNFISCDMRVVRRSDLKNLASILK